VKPPTGDVPASFEPLVLVSLEVDLLDLAVSPHRRRRWTTDDAGRVWSFAELNP
jgi:hypothetical protein